MIGLRSLRNRLAVVFGLIVLGAIGTVYLSVTPRLEERLRNQRLSALAVEARRTAKEGGAYLNNERLTDPEATVAESALLQGRFLVLRRGKRTFAGVEVIR